jgi:O-antigen ligase
MSAAAFAPSSRPPLMMSPLRWVVLIAGCALAFVAATGVVAEHAFSEQSTLKYLITVGGPTTVAVLALVDRPLWLLSGLAIVVAPFDFVASFGPLHLTPLVAVLALAVPLAIVEPPHGRPGRSAWTALASLGLLVPALAIGTQQTSYAQWLVVTALMAWITFAVASQPGGLRFVALALALSAAAQGALAAWEFKSGHQLNLYTTSGAAAIADTYFYSFGTATRSAGGLPDPIALGNVLALIGPLFAPLAVIERRPAIRIALIAGGAVCVLGVILSFSRMSWIGGGVGSVLAVLLLPGRARVVGAAGVVVVAIVMVSAGLALGGQPLRDRAGSVLHPTQATSRESRVTSRGDQYRTRVWDAAIATAEDHPIAGTGFGRLGSGLERHGIPVPSGSHAHETYLQFLGEAGLLGLIALLAPILVGFGNAATAFRRHPALAAGLVGGLVATLAVWTTDVEVRYAQVSAMIAAVLGLAAAAALASRSRSDAAPAPDEPRGPRRLRAAGTPAAHLP